VHSGSRFSMAELERRTGIPQPTISREVGRLSKADLVSVASAGRMRLVEANAASPYFPERSDLTQVAVAIRLRPRAQND
jgi:MarR family